MINSLTKLNTPKFIGIAYVFSILFFSVVYSYISSDFIYNTTKYESVGKEAKSDAINASRKALISLISTIGFPEFDRDQIKANYDNTTVNFIEYNATNCCIEFSANVKRSYDGFFHVAEFLIKIKGQIWLSRSSDKEFGDIYFRNLRIDSVVDYVYSASEKNPDYSNVSAYNALLFDAVESFRKNNLEEYDKREIGIIELSNIDYRFHYIDAIYTSSKYDEHSISQFVDNELGYGANVSPNFVRFLYFSAVTTTTLGYGDIVPITDRARIIIVIQTLLGLILAGLFLNSVASKIGR